MWIGSYWIHGFWGNCYWYNPAILWQDSEDQLGCFHDSRAGRLLSARLHWCWSVTQIWSKMWHQDSWAADRWDLKRFKSGSREIHQVPKAFCRGARTCPTSLGLSTMLAPLSPRCWLRRRLSTAASTPHRCAPGLLWIPCLGRDQHCSKLNFLGR